MKQDRLNGLALLSTENAVASELDYSSVIEKFASLKVCRVRIGLFELRVTDYLFSASGCMKIGICYFICTTVFCNIQRS